MATRRTSVRWIALAAVTALLGAFGASAASAAPPEGVSMEGTGKPVANVGLFSDAALAQKNCADNGRTTSTYEGGGPFCVNPWSKGKDNGGATAQGVTATTVKIIAYAPNEQMMTTAGESAPTNQAGGGKATADDVMKDWQKAYDAVQAQYGTYQLWGRQPEIEVVQATGLDETAQRADALTVIAKKPFMVFDLTATAAGGATVFSTLVAQKKIVTVSPSTDASNSAEQSPYRWNFGADPSSGPALVAALMGKSLQGKKAEWAGDDALRSKTRSFGVIYPTTGFDLAAFDRYLAENGAKVTEKVAYDPTNSASGSSTIATLVSKLKSSGVTSVTLFATPTVVTSIMASATEQEYFPEWIYTGFGYQEYDPFGRGNDQQQMSHAFGLAILGPAVTGSATGTAIFPWYWGTSQGNTWTNASGVFTFTYNALHYTGPTLTAANLKKGLFAVPATSTGATVQGYGKTVGLPYDEYAFFGSGRTLIWWDAKQTGPAQATLTVGQGLFQYLDGGASQSYSDFTKATPKFFDPTVSVFEVTAASLFPGGTLPTALPCTGCPSSGGTTSATS